MSRNFLKRVLWGIPVVLMIGLVSFLLTRLVPGDPVVALIGEFPVPQEYIDEMRAHYGLNEPIMMQALYYFGNLLRGDLGYSFANQQPVISLLVDRAGNTLLLVIPGLIIAACVGITLGTFALRKPGGRFDTALNAGILVVDSIPVFWLGQIAIIFFAVQMKILPVQGMFSIRSAPTGFGSVLDFLHHWVMPGTIVVLFSMVTIARVARVSLIEMSRQDFVITALAKGLTKREVLRSHILPNALMPVVTVIGYSFGQALTSTIMTEAVFGWPGLGGLFMASLTARDYPVLQGIFLLTALTVVLANIITDLVYSLIDPRLSYER